MEMTLDELMAAASKPRAYSYLRFSSKRQERGDSIRRQTKLSEDFANKHSLDLVKSFEDKGVSAFKGSNWEVGKLARFVELVNSGEIPKGSWLIVESMDRLSRETVNLALPRILDLLNTGITVATTNPEQIYTRERLEKEPFCAVEILLTAIRASEENKTKSVRGKARWDHKRANIGTAPMSARLPHWLELKDGKIVPRPERARLVKWLFEQAAAGVPTFRLAHDLNRRGEEPWKARMWHRAYVHRILINRATIGEFQPCSGPERKPTGPLQPNYFPRIVSDELFYTVANLKKANAGKVLGRVGEAKNLFGRGLCKCGLCGGSVVLYDRINNYKGQKRRYQTLVCATAKNGGKCEYRSWKYSEVESDFLRWIKDFKFDRDASAQKREVRGQIEVASGQLTEAQDKLTALFDLAGELDSKMLAAKIKAQEATVSALEERVKVTKAALSRITESAEVEIKDLLRKPEDRLALQQAIRSKVASMALYFRGNELSADRHFTVTLHNGDLVQIIGEECHVFPKGGGHLEGYSDGREVSDAYEEPINAPAPRTTRRKSRSS